MEQFLDIEMENNQYYDVQGTEKFGNSTIFQQLEKKENLKKLI